MVTTMLASISYFPVSLYLPIYTQSVDPSNTFLPNVVAATFNLVAFLASMAIGYASDKSLSATATFVGVTGGAVALGAWSTADSLAKVFIFAAIFGATTPISSYWGAATREIGGERFRLLHLVAFLAKTLFFHRFGSLHCRSSPMFLGNDSRTRQYLLALPICCTLQSQRSSLKSVRSFVNLLLFRPNS